MVWVILVIIGAINVLFLTFLVIAGLIRQRRPLTPEEIRQQVIEIDEQAQALRTWSLQQAAKKGRKVRG
jgi:hypothetical protein